MRTSSSTASSERPQLDLAPFVAFQAVALISLPLWFFFWMLFNVGKSVSERDVSIIIYFLFGTQWQVPLFLFLVSAGMWLAVVLRRKHAALMAGVALCLPLTAFVIILLLQYVDAYG